MFAKVLKFCEGFANIPGYTFYPYVTNTLQLGRFITHMFRLDERTLKKKKRTSGEAKEMSLD